MSEPFSLVTPPTHFHFGDGTDHLFRDCPALARSKSVHTSREPARFELPDPNGDVCGLCTRRMIAKGMCLPTEVVRLQTRLREALEEHCGCLHDGWCDDDDQPMTDCVFPSAACFQIDGEGQP